VSGYQRYIVGLAMRAGLSRISAVGQNLSLLCLDESFVACDAVNIQKTEMILRNIMAYSGQTHLIITSHLDTIRDAADRIVDIQRTGRFSTIAFGAVYPIIRVLKTPKATAAAASGSVAVEDLVAASAAATPMKTVEEVAVKKRGRPKKAATAPL
jgi:ABC-type nitrate/sulfonate/bicarbonate transport system ATPase subunit